MHYNFANELNGGIEMFKDKEILDRLATIETKTDSVLSILRAEKIKNASKRVKEAR